MFMLAMGKTFVARHRSIRTISAFEKSLVVEVIFTVPQTDTGGLVENTKVDGRSMFRELGNKN